MPKANHDGCAYSEVTQCRHAKGCKPAELCPGGYRVFRSWTGGGHHHANHEEAGTVDAGA